MKVRDFVIILHFRVGINVHVVYFTDPPSIRGNSIKPSFII